MKAIFRLGFVLAMIWGGLPSTFAQNTYEGLEIIFVIDQSGSMGGADFGQPERLAADPNSWRFLAVQEAIRVLGEYRQVRGVDIPIRMAVVYFGDRPQVQIDWTEIAVGTEPEWQTQLLALQDLVSADAFAGRNLGNTNFLAAYEQVAQLFSALPAQQNLRSVILLTDGEPCVPSQFDCLGNLNAKFAHMDAVTALVQSNLPAPSYQLYVMALDKNLSYWVNFAEKWEAVVGQVDRATLIDSDARIASRIRGIIEELIQAATPEDVVSISEGSEIPLEPGYNTVAVSPYLRLMQLTFYKPDALPSGVSILDGKSQSIQTFSSNVVLSGQTELIERWTFINPTPGTWTVIVPESAGRLSVFLDTLQAIAQVEVPSGVFTQFSTIPLTFLLVDDSGNPLPQYAAPFNLDVQSKVSFEDGTSQSLTLSPAAAGLYQGELYLEKTGVYRVGLLATTRDVDGSLLTIYDNEAVGSWTVSGFQSTYTLSPQKSVYQAGELVSLSLQTIDGSGAFLTEGIRAQVAILDKTDIPLGEALPFTLTDEGTFEVSLPLNDAGDFRLHISASMTQADGTTLNLIEESTSLFTVNPSLKVGVQILQPTETTEQAVFQGFPPERLAETEIIVQTYLLSDFSPIDLASIVPDGLSRLSVGLWQGETPVEMDLFLAPAEEVGQYQVRVGDLDAGEYIFRVEAEGSLNERYIFDPNAKQDEVSLLRVQGNSLYLWYAFLAFAILVPLILILVGVYLYWDRKKRGLTGKIYLSRSVSSSGYTDLRSPLGSALVLDGFFPRLRVTLKPSQFKSKKHKIKVVLECSSEAMNRQRQATAIVEVDGQAVNRLLVAPGIDFVLHTEYDDYGDAITYYLNKDSRPDYL